MLAGRWVAATAKARLRKLRGLPPASGQRAGVIATVGDTHDPSPQVDLRRDTRASARLVSPSSRRPTAFARRGHELLFAVHPGPDIRWKFDKAGTRF